MSPHINKH